MIDCLRPVKVTILWVTIILLSHSCGTVMREEVKSKLVVEPFELKDVTLLAGPFLHATDLNTKMLLDTFEPDRLLARFRMEAGLEPKAEPYDGWEAETIAGHSLGHYLRACALMYSSTGDQQFADRVHYIVDQLAECQEADPDGYIGAFKNGKIILSEQVAQGNIRSQGFDLNGLWAPFYTQHKILAGLIAAYRHCGSEKAIFVASRFADWIGTIVDDLSDEEIQKMLNCEHGGINETLVDLYEITGMGKYLSLANVFYHEGILDSLVMGKDILPGKHANTQIPKLIGLARRYEETGNVKDSMASTFFWNRVVNHHSFVTGGNSNHEYFGEPDHLTNRLSANTTETCNVYNMLKLTRHVFEWNPNAQAADFYERALFNHILSSQHPETGNVIYNLSLEMGGHKSYEDPYGFSCCVGSGMETHAKYGADIYYHNDTDLYVSQFIASRLTWREKGLTITQRTNYPEEQGTTLIVQAEQPTDLSLMIRYPYWAKQGIEVIVNDERIKINQEASSFIKINRTWEDGDVIAVHFPFSLRLETMPDDSDRVAIMYGPLVLAGDLGEVDDADANDPDYVPVIMTENRDPNVWIEPVKGSQNTFQTVSVGSPRNFILKPFYRTHDRRYSVYFDLFNQEKWKTYQQEYQAKMEARKALEARTVDFLQFGEMQPERDHQLKGEGIYVDELKGKKARVASRGGHFTFQMSVLPDQEMTLVAEYWGGYTGSKTFDILVEGEKIATENLADKQPGAFIDVYYEVPKELTKDRENVQVAFMPHVGHRAGPVFSMRTINN